SSRSATRNGKTADIVSDDDVRPRPRRMPALEHREEVARRLVVLLGRRRIEEMIAGDIVAHEECVGAGKIAADDAVALAASEPHQRFETGAEIIAAVPAPLRIVRNDQRQRRPQRRVIFDHDHARLDYRDRLPDPVVVVVDIDAEEIDLAGDAALFEQRIDILGGDEGFADRQPALIEKRLEIFADLFDARRRTFEPEPAPAFDQKLDGIAFDAGFDAELDENPVAGSDPLENLLDDAVFVGLRVGFE